MMNHFLLASLFLLTGLALGCDTTDVAESPDDVSTRIEAQATPQSLQVQGTSNAVARLNQQTGEIVVLEDRLNKQFADGGPIKRFKVVQRVNGYNLLRYGHDANGECRTEAYRLDWQGLTLVPNVQVKWISLCQSPGQCNIGDAPGFCDLDNATNECECIGSGTCVFNVAPADYEVLYIPE